MPRSELKPTLGTEGATLGVAVSGKIGRAHLSVKKSLDLAELTLLAEAPTDENCRLSHRSSDRRVLAIHHFTTQGYLICVCMCVYSVCVCM